MKRKVLAVILALSVACMGLLTACGGSGGSGAIAPSAKPMMNASIERVFTTGSYDGTKLLVVDLNVTNNASTSMSASFIGMFTIATMDGKTLVDGFLPDDNPNTIPWNTSIAPGSEGLSQLVFKLPATEGIVDLVITIDADDYSSMIEILNESIDLAGVEAIVSESEFDVKIDNVIVTDDGAGKDLIVVFFTFTNNSEKAFSFGSALSVDIFQKDIGLKNSYLPYNHPLGDRDLDSNSYTEIKKGASIELIEVYELNDATAPIEIKIIDRQSFDNAVVLEKTIEIK